MTDDSIGDELHRLSEEFKKLLGDSKSETVAEKTTPEQLSKIFGLTIDEAKAWLEQEPDYKPTDGFLQRKRTDGDLTVPLKVIFKGG